MEVIVSKPIVPFRETIIPPPTTDMVNEVIDGQVTSTRPPPGGEDEEGDATQPGVVELQTANRSDYYICPIHVCMYLMYACSYACMYVPYVCMFLCMYILIL